MTHLENKQNIGERMYGFATKLFPLTRSITGWGVRQTLDEISTHIPLTIYSVPSGTAVFDWTVPKEWNIKDAYVKNSKGEKVIDFKKNNLHVVNYSTPVNTRLSLEELKKHLYTIPDKPDWIPYRTTYYKSDWGFCLSHNDFLKLSDDTYEVVIDSNLSDGNLNYGEYVIKGKTNEEILISTHICHPSLANDNLSGIAVATFLAAYLKNTDPYYTYRFLFIPGTIGSITYLSQHENEISRIKHGLVLTGVGDKGNITYKRSRAGNFLVDEAAKYVLEKLAKPFTIADFSPFGYDERQYCSPGFNLPVGTLMRTPHGTYPEYHTSADNLEFITSESLEDSYNFVLALFEVLESNKTYKSLIPKCEPQLGKRGIYEAMNQTSEDSKKLQMAMLWILNLSDKFHSLLDIAKRSKIDMKILTQAATLLCQHELLEEVKQYEK